MAGTIRISPEEMRNRANQYQQKGQEFETLVQGMRQLLEALQQEWEGQSSQAFAQEFEDLEKNAFPKVKELIENIANTLKVTAQSLEEVDSQLAGQMRG